MPAKLNFRPHISRRIVFIGMALVLLLAAFTATQQIAQAKRTASITPKLSPIHPTFPMLDENGTNVLESGGAISTMQTCGACHDADFIEQHSFHASVGLNNLADPGATSSERAWDISPGFFGTWNSIGYRYLSPAGDERVDLTTPMWIQAYGIRHVGGGPAVYAQSGEQLTSLEIDPANLETAFIDPDTGELIGWDWNESGVIEMNCFLCHTPSPNSEARAKEIHAGNFRWANTATLLGSGIVEQTGESYTWNASAFNTDGELSVDFSIIQDPTNDNCGLCHGLVHDNVEDPLIMLGCSPERWSTITTGQIISPQKMADSGMNLDDKETLNRPWDVHAERLLNCTDCHYSLNNPLYFRESDNTLPEHLLFDPRRLEIGDYLEKPLHQFARGDSAQGNVAPELKDTMRRCDSCHSIENTHEWLPYKDRHIAAVSCESCHIPQIYSSSNMQHDWTVITLDGNATTECRGIEGDTDTMRSLMVGYEPVLLSSSDVDGNTSLAPHNLITTWFWVYGDPPRPVRMDDLEAAYYENGDFHPGVMLRFDTNEDGTLDNDELVIDTPEKEQFIKDRLTRLGLGNPHIIGEVQPYSINHDVIGGEWALKECTACHGEQSRITQSIQLSSYQPGGVMPEFVKGTNAALDGKIYTDENGALFYQPVSDLNDLYIIGHDSVGWVDMAGSLMFIGVLLGIFVHGGLRVYVSMRNPAHEVDIEKVYMYSIYERLWHWLQTFAIVLLLLTGLIIHKPDIFGLFSFRGVVLVHNVLAAILAINAFLSLFYHLVSGEIQQYIPRPRGFFDQTFSQAIFYLRGIFKGAEHPFEKTPGKKLNPLQQITYFSILNVLLPLQGITGILIWGAQRWPDLANKLGGLSFLGPFHTLIAWMFAAFILMHVYLTTTGHTPLAGIKSMIVGWDEVEVHHHSEQESGN